MNDQPVARFLDPLTGIAFDHEKYGGWTATTAGLGTEEISIYLPGNSEQNTPENAHLVLLHSILERLSFHRTQAIPFARLDVINDLDKWGLRDDNGVPFWEIYDDMPAWGTMTESDYYAEFQLMGIVIPKMAETPDEFALGFWSEVDGEHGVGVRFQKYRPVEMLSWCDFF